MRWQKSLLFLASSGAALVCVAWLGMTLIYSSRLHEFWQALVALFRHGPGLSLPADTVAPATWWTVCAAVVIDLLYLLWFYGQRRGRADHVVDGGPLSSRRYLSAAEYEALLRRRHAALLDRYQDLGLVQFLLNREAARAQQLEGCSVVGEPWAPTETNATPTAPPVSEAAAQQRAKPSTFVLLVNPLGA